MRLVTHNLLRCNVRGVSKGYPLRIEAEKTEILDSAFDTGAYTYTYTFVHKNYTYAYAYAIYTYIHACG